MSNNNERFAIVPVPDHPGYALDFVKADSILIGDMAEAMTALKDSVSAQALLRRLDEGQKEAIRTERRQAVARAAQTAILADSVDKLSRRMDAIEARFAARRRRDAEVKAKADAEATRQRIQSALDDLHSNTGDLSPLTPSSDPDASLTDQTGFATRQEPDIEDLAFPHDPKQVPQPLSVQLNEA